LNWLDAQSIIGSFGGYAVLAVTVIIFFETAFIFTSFLPGDSLLFILGLTLATEITSFPFPVAVLTIFAAAVGGSQVGFEVGLKIGPPLFERRSNWIFNPKVVKRTHEFFERYGARAVIMARFVPIIRALVPMLAGISYLERDKFLRYNLIGAGAWVGLFMIGGYALGWVPLVRDHLETSVLIVIVVSSLPFPIEVLRNWFRKRAEARRALDQ
jgi:membrane-associated protein